MRSAIKITVALVLVAALVYGALWGYSWYKVKSEVDEAIAQAAPFAEISYAAIHVSPRLDGTVGLDRIVIKPKMTSDVFRIQSVRVTFPGIFSIPSGMDEDMPEKMGLAVNGVNIELNSPLLVSLGQMQKQAERLNGRQGGYSFLNYETLGCGAVESIGLEELTRMGYQTMEFDLDMNYSYAKVKNLLNIGMAFRLKGMQSVDIKAAMRVAPSDMLQSKDSNAVVDSIQINLSDSGYAMLRNRFCAAQLESTEEAYLGAHLQQLSRKVGATFPAETVEAYRKYMHGGRMSIAIVPKPGTDFATLGQFAIKDVIDMVGLQLKLDNHEVDFTKFEWGQSYAAPRQDVPSESVNNAATSPLPAPKSYTPPRFRTTSPSRLRDFVGYKVQLKTRAGMERDGVIESAEAGTVTLRQMDRGRKGFITFSIALSDIVTAEVFY